MLPSFVIACAATYSLRHIAASTPAAAKTAVNPGAPFFAHLTYFAFRLARYRHDLICS